MFQAKYYEPCGGGGGGGGGGVVASECKVNRDGH